MRQFNTKTFSWSTHGEFNGVSLYCEAANSFDGALRQEVGPDSPLASAAYIAQAAVVC